MKQGEEIFTDTIVICKIDYSLYLLALHERHALVTVSEGVRERTGGTNV